MTSFNDKSDLKNCFDELSDEEIEFVNLFLKCEGNLSLIINESSNKVTRVQLKNKLRTINEKLGNIKPVEHIEFKTLEDIVEYYDKKNGFIKHRETDDQGGNELELPPSHVIIDKFNENEGIAKLQSLRGKENVAWMTQDGVVFANFPGLICKWEMFNGIVEKARELGGKMYRGDVAAQNGEKVGEGLSLDTIDGFVSFKFFEKKIGSYAVRRSTYFAAVLDWAGIAKNYRAEDEKGGYIELNEGWIWKNQN